MLLYSASSFTKIHPFNLPIVLFYKRFYNYYHQPIAFPSMYTQPKMDPVELNPIIIITYLYLLFICHTIVRLLYFNTHC